MSGRRRFGGEWEPKRLGELGAFRKGKGIRRTELREFGARCVRYGELYTQYENYVVKPVSRIPKDVASTALLIEKGDLLFAGSGETAEEIGTCVAYIGEEPAYAGGDIVVLRASGQDPVFLAHLLNAPSAAGQKARMAQGDAVVHIRGDHLAEIETRLPPLPEERAIAVVLTDVDDLIGSLEALIAKKRAIKQAAMQQLLTGRTRLPGFSAEWEVRTLGDHLRFLRHGSYPRSDLYSNGTGDGGVKYLHYGDIHTSERACLDPTVTALPTLAMDRARRLDRLSNGDLVFVDASEDLGGVGKSIEIVGVRGHQLVSGLHTIAVRFSKSVLADGFKAYLQFCPRFRNHLRRLAAGTKVYATNRAHIATAELRVPPLPEQRAIAAVLADMDAEIAALERRIHKTRAVKQGMMHQLLSGSIRLLIPEAAAEDESIR